MWSWLTKLASPKRFYDLAMAWIPWLLGLAIILLIIGTYKGLVDSPPDYQQGESVRIMYVHVPAAFLSMTIYVIMAWMALVGLVWRVKLAYMWAKSCASIGAVFTFLALVTGALWGKPMWGTWWVWDARLTSELILLFLYLGGIALRQAIDDRNTGDKASAVLALVGVVNIPIIHYSVQWWNTLHQGATISRLGKPLIDASMLSPLLIMIVAFFLVFLVAVLMQVNNEILERESHTSWVKQLLGMKLSNDR